MGRGHADGLEGFGKPESHSGSRRSTIPKRGYRPATEETCVPRLGWQENRVQNGCSVCKGKPHPCQAQPASHGSNFPIGRRHLERPVRERHTLVVAEQVRGLPLQYIQQFVCQKPDFGFGVSTAALFQEVP